MGSPQHPSGFFATFTRTRKHLPPTSTHCCFVVCVHVSVYEHECLCLCACVSVHVPEHMCVRAHMYACVYTCTRVYACMCVGACVSVCKCAQVCVCPCVHVYLYVCMRAHSTLSDSAHSFTFTASFAFHLLKLERNQKACRGRNHKETNLFTPQVPESLRNLSSHVPVSGG